MTQLKKILFAIVITTVLFGCSQSSNGGGDDTSTDTSVDTVSDTSLSSDVITDSSSSSETVIDSDTGIGQASDSDSFPDTASDSQTDAGTASGIDTDSTDNTNYDTSGDTESDTGTDVDAATDEGTESATATDVDTDTLLNDTSSDDDSDTGGEIFTECPLSGTIGCEGKDVWCFIGDTPGDFVASCPGSLFCEEIGEGVAQCKCKPDYYQKCEDDEIWSYDSCGNRLSLVTTCTGDEHCVERSDRSAECTVCDDYWGGENCDECLGFNGGDTDHCQCPAPGYHPIAGTNTCLSDLLRCAGGIDGCGTYDDFLSWEQAVRMCPEGFRLPTANEIVHYLFNGRENTFDGDRYRIGTNMCSEFNCGQWDADIVERHLWTANICDDESGHMRFYVYAGNLTCSTDDREYGAICIKK